MYNVVAYI